MKNWLKIFFISLIFIGIHYTSAFAGMKGADAPNAPVLYKDMIPIKWENSYEVETTANDLDWYNYENRKWANAKDENGNYWVWIPRYTYAIDGDNVHIIWSSGTEDCAENGYMIHPAFIADAYMGGNPNEYGSYKNGTGRNELTGFWVAKYMVSDNNGSVSITPNKLPDVSKNIGEAFSSCLNMDSSLGVSTHLIKASEWGAVSYLTRAFGVIPSENNTGLTGSNVSNSTTNNYYGVFDMNGPTGEYLASFVMKDVLNASAFGYVGNMLDDEHESIIDVIELTDNDNADNNGTRLKDFYGFSMYDTKDFVLYDTENVPTGSEPFFSKGGIGVGMFGYDRTNGIGCGYRPTLSIYSSYLSEDVTFFDTEASVVAGDYLVVSVNFSVDEDWKFDLDEDETIIRNGKVVSGKEKRIFDFIDLRYVQNNKSMTLTNANLNEHLIGIIEGDTTLKELNDNTVLKANTQYTIRVRVGGYNSDDVPVFLAIPGMTSKIVVNSIDVKSASSGANLIVASIANNKVRLSIYDSQGRVPVLTGVRLISAPEKTDYYLGEKLSLVGGKLEVSYGDNKAIVDLARDNVVDFENVTNTVGNNRLVELIYNGTEVTQDDVKFLINVNGNEKFYVNGNSKPANTAVIVSGIGQYEKDEMVNLKASVYPGYKFSKWTSSDVNILNANSASDAYFTMPSKDVTVTVNTIGVMRLEVVNPKTEFERGEAFGLGDGNIVAYYPDGSSEVLTLNSAGVTSNPSKNQILDELGEMDVTIKYGGAETSYKINVVKEKYNLTFYVDSLEVGSIKMGEDTVIPIDGKVSTTLKVSYDEFVSVEAIPADGYSFYGWYVSEENLIPEEYLASTNINFVMPQKSLILKASFTKAHTIKYVVNNDEYGYISGETEQVVKNGENASRVTAIANDGYKFKEWSDGRTSPDRLDQYVVEDATYTAKFVKTWVVQYLVDGVTFATRTVENGANGYISEVPSKYGYVFSKWDKDLECITSDVVTNAIFLPWISIDPDGSLEPSELVETHITGRGVKEGTFEYIISESPTDTGENTSDYVSNETFNFEGSWEKDGELYRSYVNLASKEDSSTTITIFSNNDKEIVRFDYMFAVTSGQLLGITINGTRVTEYDEEINVWHNFNREVNTVDGKIVVGISYSQDSVYLDSDYAAIKNLKTGRHWTKISSEYDLRDSAIWSENYVHVRGVFSYDNNDVTYQVVSKMFKGDNNNEGDLFTITYELNDGVDPGNPTSYTKDTEDITLINPIKDGAEFLGWTGSNGATPSKTVIIPKGSTGNRSYVANWKEEIYTITYDLNGGTVNGTNPTSYTKGSKDITLINPTRDGYVFAGWKGTGISSTSMNVIIPSGSTGNRSYTATWAEELEVSYSIKYTLNGGIVLGENPTSYTSNTPTFELINPIKDGAKFLGWTGTNGNEPEEKVIIGKGSTGNRVYVANWDDDFTITYNLNGGFMEGSSNPTSYNAKSDAITLINPVKDGYTFLGWTGTGLTANTLKVVIPTGSTGDREYTANWAEKFFKIDWKNYDGTDLLNEVVSYGVIPKYSGATPTRASTALYEYVFSGWSPKVVKATNDATYTAQFTEKLKTYKVTFNGNGSTSGTMADQTFTAGKAAKLTSNLFVKTGYSFNGWNTKANGTGISYANNASYTASSDITLYAQWNDSMEITVNFHYEDGTDSQSTKKVYLNKEYGSLPTPILTGNTFSGWYTEDNKLITSSSIVTEYCDGTGMICFGTKEEDCTICGGDGYVDDTCTDWSSKTETCGVCQGSGLGTSSEICDKWTRVSCEKFATCNGTFVTSATCGMCGGDTCQPRYICGECGATYGICYWTKNGDSHSYGTGQHNSTVCTKCNGTGSYIEACGHGYMSDHMVTKTVACEECHGWGTVTKTVACGHGYTSDHKVVNGKACTNCNNTGKIITTPCIHGFSVQHECCEKHGLNYAHIELYAQWAKYSCDGASCNGRVEAITCTKCNGTGHGRCTGDFTNNKSHYSAICPTCGVYVNSEVVSVCSASGKVHYVARFWHYVCGNGYYKFGTSLDSLNTLQKVYLEKTFSAHSVLFSDKDDWPDIEYHLESCSECDGTGTIYRCNTCLKTFSELPTQHCEHGYTSQHN